MQQAARSITQRTRNTPLSLFLRCTSRAGITGSKAWAHSTINLRSVHLFIGLWERQFKIIHGALCAPECKKQKSSTERRRGKSSVLFGYCSISHTAADEKACTPICVCSAPCARYYHVVWYGARLGPSLLARAHTPSALFVGRTDGWMDGWWRKRHNGAELRKEIAFVHLLYCAELRIWRRKAAQERKMLWNWAQYRFIEPAH